MRDMKPCPFCDGAGRVNKSRFLRSDSPESEGGIEVQIFTATGTTERRAVAVRSDGEPWGAKLTKGVMYPRPQVEGDE